VDEHQYKFLKWTALALGAAFIAFSIYDSSVRGRNSGDQSHLEADLLCEDGAYDRALEKYEKALTEAPGHIHAQRGKARALMQVARYQDALRAYEVAIAMAPEFGIAYANRGILHDRMGSYEKALADYEKSMALDEKIGEGPHWLTRFMRKQAEKPPSVVDRARYLKEQLAKPESERRLRVPEEDAKQRSVKQ